MLNMQNPEPEPKPLSLRHNAAIEDVVLGAVLMSPGDTGTIINATPPEIFYFSHNQLIWTAYREMTARNTEIDLITLTQELRGKGKLEMAGGNYRISTLTNRIASAANIKEHLLILKQLFIAREQERICQAVIQEASKEHVDPLDLLRRHRKSLDDITAVLTHDQRRNLPDILDASIGEGRARERATRDGKISGTSSGLRDLDAITGGWRRGELVVLAARPSMGKTSLALHFAKQAVIAGTRTEIFSLEMSAERIADKLLMSCCSIDSRSFAQGYMTDDYWKQVDSARKEIAAWPLGINDFALGSIGYIRSLCKVLKRKEDLGMVVIDYLQLINPDQGGNRNYNRENEVSKISRSAKALAMDLGVPVILLSQLSRQLEIRAGDHRPRLSDLRESGAIEQDADMVLFVYRPAYYQIEPTDGESAEGKGEIIIAKNRNGGLGNIPFRHSPDFAQFYNPAEGLAGKTGMNGSTQMPF